MECLRKNVVEIPDDLLLDRLAMYGLPSVFSRVWLALCLAERGEFSEAVAIGDEALRIAETGDPGYSFILASAGLGNVYVIKGDFDQAIAVWSAGYPAIPTSSQAARGPSSRPLSERRTRTSDGSTTRCRSSSSRSCARKR